MSKKNVHTLWPGYCLKCKEKSEMTNHKIVVMKNGRKAIKGICKTCNGKMFKIAGNEEVKKYEQGR